VEKALHEIPEDRLHDPREESSKASPKQGKSPR